MRFSPATSVLLAAVLVIALYLFNRAVDRGRKPSASALVATDDGGTRTVAIIHGAQRQAPTSGLLIWRSEHAGEEDGAPATYWIAIDEGGPNAHARQVSYEVWSSAVEGLPVTLKVDWRGRVTGLVIGATP